MRFHRVATTLMVALSMGAVGVASAVPAAAASADTVFGFGDAGFYGSTGGIPGTQPLASMANTPSGQGYWLASTDGGVFSFGDAGFYGSMGAKPLNSAVVGMAATPSGHGYWLAAADGGVFSFGDAGFYGSMGAKPLNSAVVGMAATPSGLGYWLASADGGVFSFGDAVFKGAATSAAPLSRFSGITAAPTGVGYWLVSTDGGVFTFGNAGFFGSASGLPTGRQAVGIESTPAGKGYWVLARATPVVAPSVQPTPVAPVPTLGVNVYFSRTANTTCDSVYPVGRTVTPPQVLTGAMTALLAGPTAAESAAGYTSWFSSATAGMLNWAHVYSNGLARIDFVNFSSVIPNASSSCGSQMLLAALDHTATQFASVTTPVYSFDGSVSAFYNWLQMAAPTVTATSTTPALVGALAQAYGQEQNLNATYSNVLGALGNVGPFANVLSAETQHVSTVAALAANHQVTLPAGAFTGVPSPATLTAACQLGASLEQATASMYGSLLAQVNPWVDVTVAFQNLQAAANQHMAAFQHCS